MPLTISPEAQSPTRRTAKSFCRNCGLYPESFAQYAPPVVQKPPGTIHDWEFFWGVASRMKLPLTLKYWTYGLSYEAIPEGLTLDIDLAPDPEDLIRYLCSHGDVTFEDLKANPSGIRPNRPARYVQPAEDNGARLQLCPPDVAEELRLIDSETPERTLPRA